MSTDREDSPTSQSSFNFSNDRSPSRIFSDWSNILLSRSNNNHRREININGNDQVTVERSNLVNISKLVIKELIEQSLRYGRTLDSDHVSLLHFFIVIEFVLKHRLRVRPKGLLGPKKDLWDILQQIKKYEPESQDIISSVKDLPNVKTQIGRARAWLRIALMQKKLTKYLKVLIDHKDEFLINFYEPDALMLSEDAVVIIGLLIGLNTIDCNLCLKEDDLDGPQGVIDFSLYLKPIPTQIVDDTESDESNDITTVLDQKNYIEEINEHLKDTIKNLQTKINKLTNSNALMKEDLAISKNKILELYQENLELKEPNTLDDKSSQLQQIENNEDVKELKIRLQEERNIRQETDKELQLQITLKAEMEVAIKLLEKDIHEKQDMIVSLRRQLDDVKGINLEMYKKLQNAEASVEHKTELINKLEAKSESMTETIKTLENKYKESEMNRVKTEQLNRELDIQTTQSEEQTISVEGDLKVEREWRISLQETIDKDRDYISKLQNELSQMKIIAQKYANLQQEYYTLKEKCLEQEQTMEELGKQLSITKLQIIDLKEEIGKTKIEGTWADDNSVTHCKACNKDFNLTRRKHHCRNCGDIFCKACSDNSTSLPSSAKPVRVCDDCMVLLIARNSVI